MRPPIAAVLVLVGLAVLFMLIRSTTQQMEGLENNSAINQTAMKHFVSNVQTGLNSSKDSLQQRLNGIKGRIDTINKKIPRTVEDIAITSLTYVPWEFKENSMIKIEKVPYQMKSGGQTTDSECDCNYGCKWNLVMTLPMGPQGDAGAKGPQGLVGNPGPAGATGLPGPRGPWGS
jgi:hypothetical protein